LPYKERGRGEGLPDTGSQGRPLAVQPLALDLAYLLLADAEALGHLLAREGRRGAGVLGLHQRQENFPATVFRQLPFLVLWHVTPLSRTDLAGPARNGRWNDLS